VSSTRELRSGRYQVRWKNPDGTFAARTFTKKADAKEHERVTARCEELGVFWKPEEPVRIPSLEDGVIAFLVHLSDTREPPTIEQYKKAIEQFGRALDAAGIHAMTVADWTLEHLRIFRRWLEADTSRRSAGRAPDTVRRLVEKIETLWSWLFTSNFHNSVPKPQSLEIPKAPQTPVRAPTFDESARCVLACEGEYRRMATLAYGIGLRISQVCDLLWSDVDFEQGLLTIRGELGKTEAEQQGRIIPLAEWLLKEMATWGTREGKIVKLTVSRQARERYMHRAWERAGVRAEIHKQRPDHAFRRGFLSGVKRAGADSEAAEFYVGHAIPGARGRYIDAAFLELRAVVAHVPPLLPSNVIALPKKETA
jgi:integrase